MPGEHLHTIELPKQHKPIETVLELLRIDRSGCGILQKKGSKRGHSGWESEAVNAPETGFVTCSILRRADMSWQTLV